MVRSPWLPFGTGEDADMRLLCLPHAGAGAAAYRAWGRGMPSHIAVCPVQPPGRERRQSERPLASVEPIVERLTPEVLDGVKPPFAFFGHSAGAVVAFELARELRRRGGPEPVHLFLAGRPAAHLPVPQTGIGDLPPEEFAAALRRLGGTPEEVLADLDVLRLMQPLMAADFSVNEGYRYRAEPALDVPITVFAATGDPGADPERMEPWRLHTTREFMLHTLDGDHFAVFSHVREVQARMAEALS